MDIRKRWVDLIAEYKGYFDATGEEHRKVAARGDGNRGHGREDHDFIVAGYCLKIDESRNGTLAWLAALAHSVDRMYGKLGESAGPVVSALLKYLPKSVTDDEQNEILLAVLRHDQPNKDDDGIVQIILQDADRITNAGPLIIARSGQFRPTIPAAELEYIGSRNPASEYGKPCSVYDDMATVLEWEYLDKVRLRTTKGREIGHKYFAFIRNWKTLVLNQFEEVGLHPWPLPGQFSEPEKVSATTRHAGQIP